MKKNYAKRPLHTHIYSCTPADLSPVKYNIFIKSNLADVNPQSTGESWQPIGLSTKIHTADCTNLYYILDGHGILIMGEDTHQIQRGDLFVIPHGANASIISKSDQLPHRWIGFTGTLCSDFERFPVPFRLPAQVTDQLWFPEKEGRNLSSRLAHDLLLIHSIMYEPYNNNPDVVEKAIDYINTHYTHKISVADMAKTLGISHGHLCRVFKCKKNMSIMEYIQQLRVSKAKRYLMHNYSITDTARLCGFPDRSIFSKTFHRIVGCTPTFWIKDLDDEDWNRPR